MNNILKLNLLKINSKIFCRKIKYVNTKSISRKLRNQFFSLHVDVSMAISPQQREKEKNHIDKSDKMAKCMKP